MKHVRSWAEPRCGVVSRWLMTADGVPTSTIDGWVEHLQEIHSGVYVTGYGPVTPLQRWWAATLTAPRTVLSHRSAAAFYGIARDDPERVHVVRPGTRGMSTTPGLLVRYSATLNGNVGLVDGLSVTMPERTIIDCWGLAGRRRFTREKLLREALRLERTTPRRLTAAIAHHAGARGIASLRETLGAWAGLPFHRCRSDAEAYALTVLAEYGITIPLVNVKINGHEADLVWKGPRRLVEIDGPSFHKDPREDAIKTAAWEAWGYHVARLPSDALFADPTTLVALTRHL